ncbi:MAG TPA: PLD nuclease N-terminal domain-containing protein [bacterium]|jgi:hypothetical protein|nr:PLD nuclease N-terminal domain-containing protein [bacterium]
MMTVLFWIALVLATFLFLLAFVGVLGVLTMMAFYLAGLVVLVLDIWAIVEILRSRDEGVKKAIWILMIFFLPVLGLALWYFLGRKKS